MAVGDLNPDVKLFDMLYYRMSEDQGKVDIYRNDTDRTKVEIDLFDKIPDQMKKHTLWIHLSETRLVINVDRKKLEGIFNDVKFLDKIIGLKIPTDPTFIKSIHSSPIGYKVTGEVFGKTIQESEYAKFVKIDTSEDLSHDSTPTT